MSRNKCSSQLDADQRRHVADLEIAVRTFRISRPMSRPKGILVPPRLCATYIIPLYVGSVEVLAGAARRAIRSCKIVDVLRSTKGCVGLCNAAIIGTSR